VSYFLKVNLINAGREIESRQGTLLLFNEKFKVYNYNDSGIVCRLERCFKEEENIVPFENAPGYSWR
jgi:hypothetical protein